jgi:hypothetical protein
MKLTIHALPTMVATNAIATAKSAPQLDSMRDNWSKDFSRVSARCAPTL